MTLSDDDLDAFLEMIEHTLCSDYLDYMEMIDGVGFYIPFITTLNYLTHPVSRKALKLKDYTKLKN
jgi:hypothetical protein